jgi:hypothetical protein
MTCSERVSQWTETVSRQLPHLSCPQANVLALWSLGMVLARSCGLSQVSALLALLLGQSEETLRQRLREWYYPAQDKAGKKRRTLEVEACFAPLLRLSCWPGGPKSSRNWPWPWMRRRWDNASPCCVSACWCAAAPSRWPGRSWPTIKKGAGNPLGKRCSLTWME